MISLNERDTGPAFGLGIENYPGEPGRLPGGDWGENIMNSGIKCVATPVKPTRRTARPPGLRRRPDPFIADAVLAVGFIEPSDEDRTVIRGCSRTRSPSRTMTRWRRKPRGIASTKT